jgi:hypothetical protein
MDKEWHKKMISTLDKEKAQKKSEERIKKKSDVKKMKIHNAKVEREAPMRHKAEIEKNKIETREGIKKLDREKAAEKRASKKKN